MPVHVASLRPTAAAPRERYQARAALVDENILLTPAWTCFVVLGAMYTGGRPARYARDWGTQIPFLLVPGMISVGGLNTVFGSMAFGNK